MTQTLEQKKESNSLVYKTRKVMGKETIYVSIRLNDECHNGHQDFAITGDIYETGKPKTDKYFISGGCVHEEILKAFPEFKIFVDLHLCDYKGIPMYPVSNGFYHLTNGFNNTKPEDQKFKQEYCDYYRITPEQFDILSTSKNKVQFGLRLQNLNILQQWEAEATAAILKLENLTNTFFVVDSKRTQFDGITKEQIQEEEERVKTGYYTPEAEAQREQEKQNKILEKLEAERDKDIAKATIEFEAKKAVLLAGGSKALDNCIFFNHTNTLAFNWRNYGNLPQSFIDELTAKITLPEGVKIETKNKK